MRRFVLGALSALTLAWTVGPARGAVCPGDCDGNMSVQINELVTCVSIALGTAQLATCSACDVDGNGMVVINELIAAVNADLDGCNPAATVTPGGPTPTPVSGAAICGNGVKEADEDCDPPNIRNGCTENSPEAPCCMDNCTTEVRRTATLNPMLSLSQIETLGVVRATLQTSGTQVLTTGRARDAAVVGPGGTQLFAPGEAPIVIRAEDVKFDPVNVLGLACACVRAVPVDAFGAGISGVGVAGCGTQGLSNVDFLVEQDHDTTPASPGNGGSSPIADDPGCTAESSPMMTGTLATEVTGITSNACLEGVGETCSDIAGTNYQSSGHVQIPSCVGGTTPGATCAKATDCPGANCSSGPHPGMACTSATDCGGGVCKPAVCKTGPARPAACNSPRVYTFSGGQAPRGSTLLVNSTSQTLLQNVAQDACAMNCSNALFGPDCMPCTDDDTMIVAPMIVPTTSGTATIKVYDANDSKGTILGDGAMCNGMPCIGKVSGALADCDALKNNPAAPLSGALVTASPTLDSQIGDVVLTTTLEAQVP